MAARKHLSVQADLMKILPGKVMGEWGYCWAKSSTHAFQTPSAFGASFYSTEAIIRRWFFCVYEALFLLSVLNLGNVALMA